ncbi:MAG: VWA domain-containing protein [Pyrinomonadaceae bacterium]
MNTLSSPPIRRLFAILMAVALFTGQSAWTLQAFGQARRLPSAGDQKKNPRPDGNTPQPEEELPPSDVVNKPQEAETLKVTSALVNIDTVVYRKKSGQIVTGLKKANFVILEDGVPKDITYFSTPEAPITVAMVLEYSRLSNYLSGNWFEYGIDEILRPASYFLSQFVRPPDDFVSVTAYDMRATPLTDFTNDPGRIRQVIDLLLRNFPASSEANLYDALKLTLVGGRGDSVLLENSKERTSEYAGLSGLTGRRKAVLLICSGVDTFSKINYDQARKIAQNAGVPIYIIGTGNMFMKRFGDQIGATDGPLGNTTPGRLTLLQAQNSLSTFAKETGGMYFPVTFEGELPKVLGSINGLLRSQYSLGYNPGDARDGKRRKLLVKVDVDGDGQPEEKEYVIQHRQFYTPGGDNKSAKAKK